jgi:hypothetical protein
MNQTLAELSVLGTQEYKFIIHLSDGHYLIAVNHG